MPEAILKYILPEDDSEYTLAVNGSNAFSVLWGLDCWLREQTKYKGIDTVDVDVVREKIRDLMSDNGINLNMYS
jgi:hypothetical protein